MGEGCANDKLLGGYSDVVRDEKRGTYLVHARPDAAPVGDGTDRDDVDAKEGDMGCTLCDALVDGTLEGLEICLRESEDVLWFDEFDSGGEEHGEIAL